MPKEGLSLTGPHVSLMGRACRVGAAGVAMMVVAAICSTACSPSAGYRARVQSAGRDGLACSSDLIVVHELSDQEYAAEGCGRRQYYVCTTNIVGAAHMIGGGMAIMTAPACTPVGPIEAIRRSSAA